MLNFSCFLITLLCTVIYAYTAKNRVRLMHFITFIILDVSNLGYFLLTKAQDLSLANISYMIGYIGTIYLPIMCYLTIEQICNLRKRDFEIILVSLSTFMYIVATTTFSTGLFYKEVKLDFTENIVRYNRVYGLMYYFKYFLFVLFILFIIRLIKDRDKKIVPKRLLYMLLTLYIFIAVGSEVLVNIGFNNIVVVPINYVIVCFIYLYISYKLQLFDVNNSLVSIIDSLDDFGYIVLDNKFNYMSSDSFAKSVFQDLYSITLNTEITDKYLSSILDDYREKNLSTGYIEIDKKYIEYKIINEKYFISDVYIIQIQDETSKYKTLQDIQKNAEELALEIEEQKDYISVMQNSIVLGMSSMIESRDTNTGGHVKRASLGVQLFVSKLRTVIHKDNKYWDNVIKAAPLHDLGKIAVDDNILRKPGKFTNEEYEEMKKHAEQGAYILQEILKDVDDKEFKEVAINVAHYHHEKYNGTGYPDKLKGEQIPLEARVMALADVFDALVSRRCYKDAFDFDKAFGIIEYELGEHFDPDLGRIFLDLRPELEKLYKEIGGITE